MENDKTGRKLNPDWLTADGRLTDEFIWECLNVGPGFRPGEAPLDGPAWAKALTDPLPRAKAAKPPKLAQNLLSL